MYHDAHRHDIVLAEGDIVEDDPIRAYIRRACNRISFLPMGSIFGGNRELFHWCAFFPSFSALIFEADPSSIQLKILEG